MTDPTPGVYEKAIGAFNDSERPLGPTEPMLADEPGYLRARGAVGGSEPAERIIRRMREGRDWTAPYPEGIKGLLSDIASDRELRPNAWPRFRLCWPFRLRRGGRQ